MYSVDEPILCANAVCGLWKGRVPSKCGSSVFAGFPPGLTRLSPAPAGFPPVLT